MFGVELLCSDESCAEVIEAVGDLDRLGLLVCDGCGATLEIVSIWESEEARPRPSIEPVELRPRSLGELSRAA